MQTSPRNEFAATVAIRVLAINPREHDLSDLKAIFLELRWELQCVRTLTEAFEALKRPGVPVVICESSFPEGDWKLLFQRTREQAQAPSFIVSSRLADDYLWSEVLNLGGYDVLATPFSTQEVTHVVRCAWESWKMRWGLEGDSVSRRAARENGGRAEKTSVAASSGAALRVAASGSF